MSNPLLKHALREIAALEVKLNTIAEFRQWQALRVMVAEYQGSAAQAMPAVGNATPPMTGPPSSPVVPKPLGKAPVVVAAAVKLLKEHRRRMTSSEMAPALKARGLDLGGNRPAATLSAYLSAAPEIDNVRGEGYGLKEWAASKPAIAPESEAPDSGKLSSAPVGNGITPFDH